MRSYSREVLGKMVKIAVNRSGRAHQNMATILAVLLMSVVSSGLLVVEVDAQ